jgi:hypothetical protein
VRRIIFQQAQLRWGVTGDNVRASDGLLGGYPIRFVVTATHESNLRQIGRPFRDIDRLRFVAYNGLSWGSALVRRKEGIQTECRLRVFYNQVFQAAIDVC